LNLTILYIGHLSNISSMSSTTYLIIKHTILYTMGPDIWTIIHHIISILYSKQVFYKLLTKLGDRYNRHNYWLKTLDLSKVMILPSHNDNIPNGICALCCIEINRVYKSITFYYKHRSMAFMSLPICNVCFIDVFDIKYDGDHPPLFIHDLSR
jgi:hypothetical protein